MTIDTLGFTSPVRGVIPGDAAPAQPPAGRAPAAATQTATAVAPTDDTGSIDALKDAVGKLNQSMQTQSQSLEFSIDEDSKRTIVKVIDQATREVVRQIPTEEALQIAKSLDNLTGLLISQRA